MEKKMKFKCYDRETNIEITPKSLVNPYKMYLKPGDDHFYLKSNKNVKWYYSFNGEKWRELK